MFTSGLEMLRLQTDGETQGLFPRAWREWVKVGTGCQDSWDLVLIYPCAASEELLRPPPIQVLETLTWESQGLTPSWLESAV